MSTRPRPPALPAEPAPLVQQLLTEKRDLMVANERMRLEVAEMRARVGRPDPRLARLEEENRRLRAELAAARDQRDGLQQGVADALDQLRRA